MALVQQVLLALFFVYLFVLAVAAAARHRLHLIFRHRLHLFASLRLVARRCRSRSAWHAVGGLGVEQIVDSGVLLVP